MHLCTFQKKKISIVLFKRGLSVDVAFSLHVVYNFATLLIHPTAQWQGRSLSGGQVSFE